MSNLPTPDNPERIIAYPGKVSGHDVEFDAELAVDKLVPNDQNPYRV